MAKKPKNRGKDRPLTQEEARLWSRVAQTTAPLPHGALPDAEDLAEDDEFAPFPENDRDDRPTTPAAAPSPRAGPPPLATLDRHELRQIATKGKSVDARIDLHGMRQREAHMALMVFLQRAQSEGHRYVLVITGKGNAKRRDDETTSWAEGAGVLKRAVPHWLEEPAFRQLVVGFGPAHVRHGGGGALYIRLRRER
jgi:DNA-nicking Smr family endonuclease